MSKPHKKRFSGFNLREALTIIGTNQLKEWEIDAHPVQPSANYKKTMNKLKSSFDLSLSEAAKVLWIDMILFEAVAHFKELKVWKEASLQTDTIAGALDYLIAPQGTVYQSPLLCVVEAKKDDFEKGMAQCLVEMCACRDFNKSVNIDIYGIVTNAIHWEFYKLTPINEAYKSPAYSEIHLEEVLGVLHFILTQCVANLKKFDQLVSEAGHFNIDNAD